MTATPAHDSAREAAPAAKGLSPGVLFGVVWRVNKLVWGDYRWTMLALLGLLLLLSAAPVARSGLQGLFINELVPLAGGGKFTPLVVCLLAGAIAIDMVSSFLVPLQTYLKRVFQSSTRQLFQLKVVKKKGELDIAAHENPDTLTMIEKINQQGVWRIEYLVGSQFYLLGNCATLAFTSAVVASTEAWVLLLIVLGTLPEIWVSSRLAVKYWKKESSRAEQRRHLWDIKYLFDRSQSVMELKIFGNVEYFYNKVATLWRQLLSSELEEDRTRAWAQLSSMLLSNVTLGVSMAWFVWQVVQGHLQIGTMTFLLASLASFRMALGSLFSESGYFYEHALFASEVLKLFDTPAVIQSPPDAFVLPAEITPSIEFRDVTFSYPGAAQPSLKNFSLKIAPGEKVALVGVNGAGKTTLIKLLCRFYDPQQGQVLLQGRDLRTLDLPAWYQHLSVVFQDFTNYNLLAKDAIALGQTRAPFAHARVQAAAVSAEADKFIQQWKLGYDQPLGKIFHQGVEPSGGQWQKLALARIFFRGANVLILDEPTSAIDAEAEAKIFEQMSALPKDKTVVLISHRFSTVRQADKIVVIDAGQIIESGSHHELIALGGTYQRLFSLQAKGYQ